jgi:hypothetical protein
VKYGNLNSNLESSSYHFSTVNGSNAYFKLKYISIKFISKMNSFIYVEGGIICMEYMKVENERTLWNYPLIDASYITSFIIIEIYCLNITNCYYKYGLEAAWPHKSSIVFFNSQGLSYPFFLNISSSFFQNTTFYLNHESRGGSIYFRSKHGGYGFFFFFF